VLARTREQIAFISEAKQSLLLDAPHATALGWINAQYCEDLISGQLYRQ
jgi:hypothetical protein